MEPCSATSFSDPTRSARSSTDHHEAGLDDIDVAVMDLADQGRGRRLRGHRAGHRPPAPLGLSDADILDVVLAAAARCFFSKTLDGLGVEPDARFAELEPALRDALTVGRAISDP